MVVPQSEAFLKATEDSKKLTSKPDNNDLLELYGSCETHDIPIHPHMLTSLAMM
jgi:hypothetical protein